MSKAKLEVPHEATDGPKSSRPATESAAALADERKSIRRVAGSAWRQLMHGKSLRKLLGLRNQPALWGLNGLVDPEVWAQWQQIVSLKKKPATPDTDWSNRAGQWLQAWSSEPWTLASAGTAIVVARHLPQVALHLDIATGERLVEFLDEIAHAKAIESADQGANLIHAWLQVELPLLVAHWLAPSESATDLHELGVLRWDAMMRDSFDGEGQPHGRDWPWLRALWASVTMALALADADRGRRKMSKVKPAKDARLVYSWLVRQSLRSTRFDGRSTGGIDAGSWDELLALARVALSLEGDRDDERILEVMRGKAGGKSKGLPVPGDHSEWAETALLRGGWQRSAAVCGINFERRGWTIELSAEGHVLWQGSWMPSITVNGQTLKPVSDWSSTCWETDSEVEYLELEMELEGGWRLQRQCCLARPDCQLFLADALLGTDSASIHYSGRLPLANGVQLTDLPETTEIHMGVDRPLATLLPLALPEWKGAAGPGSLSAATAEWTLSTQSSTLYAPLVIDLDRRRVGKELTWRALTVAEGLEIVSNQCAMAFRYQIGKRQWVVYRALSHVGNRTFLGQNLSSEFLWARFDTSGDTETLIEIE
ncbi:MAG: hypothetical protein U0795_03675 [Pirellulales bacterium]